jgi:hypothetical protein
MMFHYTHARGTTLKHVYGVILLDVPITARKHKMSAHSAIRSSRRLRKIKNYLHEVILGAEDDSYHRI